MADDTDRGREATGPREITGTGWRDILWRVWASIGRDHVSVVAAGVAFYALLALFPAIVVLISVAGLIVEPTEIEAQLQAITAVLPQDAATIIQDQARSVAASDSGSGLAAILGLAIAIFSASKGVKTLMEGLNIANDEEEKRSIIMLNVVALTLTLGIIIGLSIALAITIAAPILLGHMGLSSQVETLVNYGRWVILALLAMVGMAMLYRYGPSRAHAKWRWISPGAVVATLLWIAGSVAFSLYIRNFGSYNETYGALGGVIILLTWLWLSAFLVLIGAELDAEMEHQTERDSTTGEPKPKGERGAVKADTLGKVP